MLHDDITRYRLELEMLERQPGLDELDARALLQRELALAVNAAYFRGLSRDEIALRVLARWIPQEGVGRYAVELDVVERVPSMSDAQAGQLLQRTFRHAQNAAHFVRVAVDDYVRVTLVERVRPRTVLRVT